MKRSVPSDSLRLKEKREEFEGAPLERVEGRPPSFALPREALGSFRTCWKRGTTLAFCFAVLLIGKTADTFFGSTLAYC